MYVLYSALLYMINPSGCTISTWFSSKSLCQLLSSCARVQFFRNLPKLHLSNSFWAYQMVLSPQELNRTLIGTLSLFILIMNVLPTEVSSPSLFPCYLVHNIVVMAPCAIFSILLYYDLEWYQQIFGTSFTQKLGSCSNLCIASTRLSYTCLLSSVAG